MRAFLGAATVGQSRPRFGFFRKWTVSTTYLKVWNTIRTLVPHLVSLSHAAAAFPSNQHGHSKLTDVSTPRRPDHNI
jgi:hypothetical protein